ncbi:amidohydrolase [Mycetocola reblochoni]|uniref:N-acetyl-L,L-diaminopimelate deacetylase n=2 Tax=Mycetocola reblochoni TaxID=331618 RepID=A0A1R4JMW3_9MICO|nr:amidohydrolase [Mycetocola reblochoni]RLP68595.1 amidohydrolase [Mycetocola reblochoni]SJN33366.1 N-acetyl-L,L-diaminopimelate deacetylase [Mycetocola reblochoni REB411]
MTPATELPPLTDLYTDLHAHPELSLAETRTAGIVAERLRAVGCTVDTGVGGTGVVGVLDRGDGPTVLLRADMDALPVAEQTGLPYRSTVTTVTPDGREVPVMHACGHDMHTAALLGAVAELAADTAWSGRALAVFQPAEELGTGAAAMVADGLFERFGTPDVVLGQHVAPLPAGVLGVQPGPAFAGSDALTIRLYGRGGHGSRPETTIDPVVLAAAVILRLQTIVSREVAGAETAVLTVGSVHAGTAPNIIPDTAELTVGIRTFTPQVRDRILTAIERIVRAECAASGAEREPEFTSTHSFPPLVNDGEGARATAAALAAGVPGIRVIEPGPVTGSEDVGGFATASGAPLVYWILGGADPSLFAGARDEEDIARIVAEQPSNHSPFFAPVIEPTLGIGVAALRTAALHWLAR